MPVSVAPELTPRAPKTCCADPTPPERARLAPLLIVALIMLPPVKTTSRPPLPMIVISALPPAETIAKPPLLTKLA